MIFRAGKSTRRARKVWLAVWWTAGGTAVLTALAIWL